MTHVAAGRLAQLSLTVRLYGMLAPKVVFAMRHRRILPASMISNIEHPYIAKRHKREQLSEPGLRCADLLEASLGSPWANAQVC